MTYETILTLYKIGLVLNTFVLCANIVVGGTVIFTVLPAAMVPLSLWGIWYGTKHVDRLRQTR